MKIAAYCRVSTDKQDQINSLEAQKAFFAAYTARTGDELVRLYADEGISGTKIKNRREFLRMMEEAEHRVFDLLVVKDISRFARNTVDLLQSIRALKALGIETQFLTANMTSMGNSEFVLTIFGALAQEESANTSKRVKFGKRLGAEKGRVPNLVYGYDKMEGDCFHLSVNAAEAETVRRIYDWYVQEGCGASRIAARLNEMGLHTKRGCAWGQAAVCRILRNPIYTGRVVNGKQEVADFLTGKRIDKAEEEWIVVHRPELCIVQEERFEQVQSILRERSGALRMQRTRPSNKYPLSALIRCRDCGWAFRRVERTYRNTYVAWVCSGRNLKGAVSCENDVKIDERELLQRMSAYFAQLLSGKKQVMHLAIRELARRLSSIGAGKGEEKELRTNLRRLQRQRQRCLDMYADGLISRQELNARIGFVQEQMDDAQAKIDLLTSDGMRGISLEETLRTVFAAPEDLCDLTEISNAQLRRIVERIEVSAKGEVDVYLRSGVPNRSDRT